MKYVLMVIGIIVGLCGVVLGFKNGREKPNGIMEWILLIVGIAIFMIAMNYELH